MGRGVVISYSQQNDHKCEEGVSQVIDTPSRMFVLMGGLTRQPSMGCILSAQEVRPFSSHTHRAADSWTVPVAYCAFPVKFPSAKTVFSIRNLSLQSEERLFKDEYLLDFINVEEMKVDKPADVDERVVEHAIVRNVKQFILPFGRVLSAFAPRPSSWSSR